MTSTMLSSCSVPVIRQMTSTMAHWGSESKILKVSEKNYHQLHQSIVSALLNLAIQVVCQDINFDGVASLIVVWQWSSRGFKTFNIAHFNINGFDSARIDVARIEIVRCGITRFEV